jgi:hypothetical protein
MPRFGNASLNGFTAENRRQAITIHGMNLQWPNTCPGHTDRASEDFLTNRHRATEVQIGSFCGSIEYVIDRTPVKGGVNLCQEPFFEEGHGPFVRVINLLNSNEQ